MCTEQHARARGLSLGGSPSLGYVLPSLDSQSCTPEHTEHGQDLFPHEHAVGNQMKAFQPVGQPLLITGQLPEAAHSPEGPLDHRVAWQQHEAALDVGQFDDL